MADVNDGTKTNGSACTEACRTPVDCTVCGLRKQPRGRCAPMEMANGLCSWDCAGYMQDPKPPHLWPGEDFEP